MWLRAITKFLPAAGALLTVVVGGAVAQPPAEEQPATGSPTEDQKQGEPPAGTIEAEEAADLSGKEQLKQARKAQEDAKKLSRRVQSMLDEARREGDIIRITCLNDKLSQINANRRTLGDRIKNLKQAVEAGDTDRRNHEYTVVTVLAQKFETLEQEANQCLGEEMYETGATRIVTDIEPGAPDEDPTQVEEPPRAGVPFIPPPSSPVS